LDTWYLINTEIIGGTVILKFCDASGERIEEVEDGEYEPYFLVPYPVDERDKYTVNRIVGGVSKVQKHDLLSNKTRTLAKITIKNPENVERFSKLFESVWENEIEFSRGYIYDHGLVFGSQYTLKGSNFTPISDVPRQTR